jgi:hypothetical protein
VSRDNDTILSGERRSEKGPALKSAAPMITALRVASFFMIFLPLVSTEVEALEAAAGNEALPTATFICSGFWSQG